MVCPARISKYMRMSDVEGEEKELWRSREGANTNSEVIVMRKVCVCVVAKEDDQNGALRDSTAESEVIATKYLENNKWSHMHKIERKVVRESIGRTLLLL